jgi:hypothetical protein
VTAPAEQPVSWRPTADRAVWAAEGPGGTVLTVSRRAAGGWQSCVDWARGTAAGRGESGPVLPRRLAAEAWAEQRAAR